METNNDNNVHNQSEMLLKFANELAISCYESELRRQSQLLDQSRTVQTVFSIISVAITALIPWLKDILRGNLKLIILTVVFYFIVFVLLILSLIFACLAQHRPVLQTLPDIDVIEKTVNDNFQVFLNRNSQEQFKLDEFKIIQKDITKDNDRKVKLLNIANILLIISICLIFLFAFIITIILFFI